MEVHNPTRLLIPLLFSVLAISADTLPPDGPYLIYEGEKLVARWADTENSTKGETVFDPTDLSDLPRFASFDPTLVDPARKFPRETVLQYAGVSKVVAISDIHGQFDTGRELLAANGIIDENLHWTFADGHLVIVGDIFDRGDQVTELLWLIHNLQIEAAQVGGRVHFLLGNHEVMTLEGDERYLNDKYLITSGLTGKFYRDLYGPDTYLGRWLRSLPLAVKVNGTVFIHGGISRAVAQQVNSLEALNALYHDELMDVADLGDAVSGSTRLAMLHGRGGPLWYRGYFSRNKFTDRDLNYVLKRFDAERVVVGHTSFTAVQGFFDNRIIAVDSSIKFGGLGELLFMQDGALYRHTLTGERIPLDSNPTK